MFNNTSLAEEDKVVTQKLYKSNPFFYFFGQVSLVKSLSY